MSSGSDNSLEAEGIFVGKPSKEDLISYFMKQQRLTTLKKLEENDRDTSPELSESFEIYLEQKKKKIEIEKEKIISENSPMSQISSKDGSINNISCNEESFLELEKICENTLNLNNISEILTDLTALDLGGSNAGIIDKNNLTDETRLFEIEQPSLFLENTLFLSPCEMASPARAICEKRPSTIMEVTEVTELSYKTTQSHIQSITSTDKSTYYSTANDKSFDVHEWSNNDFEQSTELGGHPINDTLDEIDFLLSQAQKINNEKLLKPQSPMTVNKKYEDKRLNDNLSPYKNPGTPKSENKQKLRMTPKQSPLISFSPTASKNSPSGFKYPNQPTSSTKKTTFSKLNSKKFSHIVSPISRYIQTSEPVLNANAHVKYKGSSKTFNFRDSENFDKSLDNSVKTSSLPLRVKTNYQAIKHQVNSYAQRSDGAKKNDQFQFFVNNTLDDSEMIEKKMVSDMSSRDSEILKDYNF